jgi:hypothetical protein
MKLKDKKEKLLGAMAEQQRQSELMNKNIKELQTRAQTVLMEQVRSLFFKQMICQNLPLLFF